ncbi:hypothetical protein LCGC14_3079000 [marine sediment metagenome]|uniref:Uncharacterized protein n=1 Tax=marine sediment metagenome TaxID=412755 RepID=A0A0F8YLG0_9ZZZZ
MKKGQKKPRDKYHKVKDKWIKATEKWLLLLWLPDFNISWYFNEIPDEDEGRDGWKPIASVVAKPHYFDAVITADPAQLILMDDDDLDSKACHEVMHIVLSPYHEWGETMLATMDKKEVLGYREYELVSNERVTSRLAQIVRKLFKNSKDGPCCHKHEPKQRIPKAKKS